MAILMAGLLLATSCFGGADDAGSSALRVAILQPASLDPVRIRDTAGALIARQVFSPLASFDPNNNRLLPGAADWETHDGGARYIFRLREGIKFHNGRPVRAADVVFSLNRLASKATGSDLSFLLDKVLGFEQVNQLGTASELEGVRVLDDSTIEIRLVAGWFDFPYALTHPATAPLPMEEFLADPEGFRKRPIGSGPYAFDGPVEPGGDIFLDSYEPSDDLKVRKVSFLVHANSSSAFRAFERESVNVAEVPLVGARSLETFRGTPGFVPVAAMLHLGFNLNHPKFADSRFREAISLAIDRTNLAQNGYFNTLSPASGLVPRGLPGRARSPCGNRCERDLDRARSLIAEAVGGSPPPVTFDFPLSSRDEAAAELLREALDQIGISVELRGHELIDYVGLLGSEGIEMFRLGWVAEYPLADWFMSPLFRSDSPDNRSGYRSEEVDAMISRARSEPDSSTRYRLYRELEARLMQDMPVVPLGQFESRYAARDVEGFYVDALGTFEARRMDGI